MEIENGALATHASRRWRDFVLLGKYRVDAWDTHPGGVEKTTLVEYTHKKRDPSFERSLFIVWISKRLSFCFVDDHLGHFIAGTDGVYYLETFHYFSKAGVVAVEMGGVAATVANEKL